ncbi:hypothetical protein RFI_32147 [Reticulomyxa filosa]|uniref:Uncharacterized protein n=1 Tax=Reticulomyxa filosa TaxID=46433 RepID=X6LV53_RETFI|nr:hypothetical protein RFI_32147 [Reticulomyxa filosa]|eukprot:ETO05251.1 hypothetical protein RFI_32147 [Reticulomyxa filosa]
MSTLSKIFTRQDASVWELSKRFAIITSILLIYLDFFCTISALFFKNTKKAFYQQNFWNKWNDFFSQRKNLSSLFKLQKRLKMSGYFYPLLINYVEYYKSELQYFMSLTHVQRIYTGKNFYPQINLLALQCANL